MYAQCTRSALGKQPIRRGARSYPECDRFYARSKPVWGYRAMDVVGIWTGLQANALLKALRLTNEGLADRLGIAVRTVAKWNANPTLEPTPEMQQALDTLLARAPGDAKVRFAQILRGAAVAPTLTSGPTVAVADIARLVSEITESDTSDDAIVQLIRATTSIAEAHTQAPATRILTEVLRLHGQARTLLAGRLRLSQKRELFRVESELLSHACLLLGDLKQDQVAENCGQAALSYAREAGTNQAIAWSVLAKTLRWEDRFIESADMARQGYECSPLGPIRVELASREANAAALLGDTGRAREALKRAEVAAESVAPDSGVSAWSFPIARQAVFALSVATQASDASAMLQAASLADAGWSAGEPRVPATWAQIRIGAGIAHLMTGSLDGALHEVTPVLALPPELRMATVTAYIDRLDQRLAHTRFQGSKVANELSKNLKEFNSNAVSAIRLREAK
jgi:hypothetical protein